ncbi:MAG: GNAT family N-acetyltransferase [Methylophaga sp.]|nr:GNAT family N-acetyltransferase [Methylophaga sp.]
MKAHVNENTVSNLILRPIKVATAADIDALNSLLNHCASTMAVQGMQHWLGVYNKQSIAANVQQKAVYTLRDKQQIVACVTLASTPADYYADCWPHAPQADFYLTMLAVAPDCQQQGLGKLMVQFCQQQIPVGQNLQLDAVAHYPALLDFYRQLGFQRIAEGIGLGDKRYLFSWLAR